jgi:L-asparaginase
MAFEVKKPSIIILGTGGTIGSKSYKRSNGFYHSPSLTVKDIANKIPEIKKIANIKYEQFSNIISQEIDDTFLLNLGNRITQLINQKEVNGIIITHGTNAIEETAYFLNLVVKSKKPIVMTGAMHPSDSLLTDGASNLFNAIILAIDKNANSKGVLITFNGTINNARDAIKNNIATINNFTNFEVGSLGSIHNKQVYFYRAPTTRHTYLSKFGIQNLQTLPKVAIIYTYIGCNRTQIDAALSDNAKGIVCIGMGNGYFPSSILPALIEARKKGVFIVRTSRVPGGIVMLDPKLDDKYGFIVSNNLSPQKSRILLALAISQNHNRKNIQKIFNEY